MRLRASSIWRTRSSCSGSGLVSASDIWSNQLLAISSRRLLEELLEVLAGLGRDEVVLLQSPHPAGQVGGQQVQLDVALGHDLVGDLLAALVARLAGVVGQGLSPARSSATTSSSSWAISWKAPPEVAARRAPPGAAGAGAPSARAAPAPARRRVGGSPT